LAFTFFFRDQQVLERVVEHSLPILAGRTYPRIWDAGAAMGQEPYTFAIMFAERMGRFPREELSRLPDGILEKYFEPGDKPESLRVIEKIRQRVTFHQHDLLSLREIGQGYSVILCKNVLLHFQPLERIEVLRMFHRALAPGGFLATEHTQEMPRELGSLFQRVIPDGPVYRRLESAPCGL
jgi:chemotaxis protein methyltransferase CheR